MIAIFFLPITVHLLSLFATVSRVTQQYNNWQFKKWRLQSVFQWQDTEENQSLKRPCRYRRINLLKSLGSWCRQQPASEHNFGQQAWMELSMAFKLHAMSLSLPFGNYCYSHARPVRCLIQECQQNQLCRWWCHALAHSLPKTILYTCACTSSACYKVM